MNRFENIVADVRNLYERGWLISEIADELDLDLMTVRELVWCDVLDEADRALEADPGDMDGDHASALASAGWGTDEDYGYSEDVYYDEVYEFDD